MSINKHTYYIVKKNKINTHIIFFLTRKNEIYINQPKASSAQWVVKKTTKVYKNMIQQI
jgi:hypothetical protein